MGQIKITALTPAACSTALWRRAGTWWVTVVVKATYRLVPGQTAQATEPLALVREDLHRARSGSLAAASETVAPYLPGTGVVLTGHAYAPGGRPATAATARLALGRDRPLLDKTIHAYGDRFGTAIDPFEKMPLVYERAYGGPTSADNPVGVGGAGTATSPNLYDPRSPEITAGFGPISRSWPARRRLLGTFDETALHAPEPEIPEGIDWRYFHAAPPDQQLDVLRGDEWIVLDGMHPTLARVQTRLPSGVARASWHRMKASGPEPGVAIELAADTLIIDADRLECSVLWRGRFALERIEMAPWLGVFAGVVLPGQSISWPALKPASRAELEEAKTMAVRFPREAMTLPLPSRSPDSPAITSVLDLRALLASIPPFKPAAPQGTSDLATPRVPLWTVPERASDSPAATGAIDFQKMLKDVVPFRPAAPPSLASADPAATGAMDARRLRPSLPFTPPDASKASFEAQLQSAPRSIVARSAESLTGTAQSNYQDILREILPFKPDPQVDFNPAAPPRFDHEPSPPSEHRALLPEAPYAAPGSPPFAPPPPAYAAASPKDEAPPIAPPAYLLSLPLSGHLGEHVSSLTPPSTVLSGSPDAYRSSATDVTSPTPVLAPAPVSNAPHPAIVAPAAPHILAEPSTKAPSVNEPASLRAQILARLQERGSLHGLPLANADLRDFDFSGASLAGLDLRRSNLQRATLCGARAAEAQFEGADLTETNFERADLTRANLTRAIVTKARFDGAILTSANLQRLSGDAPSFRSAKLQGADLRQASLSGANFNEAILSKAQVAKADLSGSCFVRADLSGANLRECKLREADFTRANFESAELRDADVFRAKFDDEARKTAKLTPPQAKSLGGNKS